MAILFSNKMLYCACLWMAFLALLLLIFSSYLLLGFCFLSILYTSTAMVFSTVIYIASKHKAVVHVDVDNDDDDKLVEERVLSYYEEKSSDQLQNFCKLKRVITEAKEEGQEDEDDAPSPDLLSVSESEVDYSDGSISDEESLIEIALPSGHYVDPQRDYSNYNYKCNLQQKKRELSAEALFSQQSLMEFLSEFNEVSEEENLIEIDISMGSIKYSRFEIEA